MKTRFAAAAFLVASLCAHGEDAFVGKNPAQRRPGTSIRIDLIGDSTQTDNAGYGRGFCANLSAKVDCLNMAKGGASTRTYRELGLWDRALSTKPDYMLIQFGHNDMESAEHNDRQVPIAVYEQNLRNFVKEARTARIQPVLITPLTRRYFGPDGKVHSDLLAHAAVVRKVAAEEQVPLIDLQAESIAYLDSVGETRGNALGITKKDKDGNTIPDKTHLNWKGSYVFGRMVAVDVGKVLPALRHEVARESATLPPEGQVAMRAFERQPVMIVLVGDSTTATEGGWGPGFCATLTPNVTCIDLGANGRSTKSYIDEGLWKKALARRAEYYTIQFGHNDQKDDPLRRADADGLFSDNLHRFIHDVRAQGGIPIVISPLSRRTFKNGVLAKDGLEQYTAAARLVAGEEHVNFVDLNGLSHKLLSGMTQEQADDFNMMGHPDAKAENAGPAKPDRTHLNSKGKAVFGRMVADNLIRSEVELGPDVVGLPEGATASPVQSSSTDGR